MKFRTAFERSTKPTPCPSGSRYRQMYVKKIYDGKAVLEKAGIEDVYDSIQKAAPGNLIEDLLRRARSGDTSAIPEPIDSYVDISRAPKDLLEAHQMLASARSKYDALPADLKAVFNNDYTTFLEASSNGKAVEAIQSRNSSPENQPLTLAEISKLRSMIGGSTNA